MGLTKNQRPLVGVAVFLYKGNSYYLQQRDSTLRGLGSWSLPGGHVEYGEGARESAVREVKEETGITVDQHELIFLGFTSTIFEDVKAQYITLFYACDLKPYQEPYEAEKGKSSGHMWVHPHNTLPAPLFEPLRQFLEGDKETQGYNPHATRSSNT